MIVAKQKPLAEIKSFIDPYKKVLLVGCGTCVTVCLAGGEKETKEVASALRIAYLHEGVEKEIVDPTITRQCDPEFVQDLIDRYIAGQDIEAVITMACGVGANYLAERLPGIPVYPGQNTLFYGGVVEPGKWREYCAGCGECMVHKTGGLCPVARCAKTIMNGPCGGTNDGKCELGGETDCIWYLIVKRMTELGRLEELMEFEPPRSWTTARDGGPRVYEVEDKETLVSPAEGKPSSS